MTTVFRTQGSIKKAQVAPRRQVQPGRGGRAANSFEALYFCREGTVRGGRVGAIFTYSEEHLLSSVRLFPGGEFVLSPLVLPTFQKSMLIKSGLGSVGHTLGDTMVCSQESCCFLRKEHDCVVLRASPRASTCLP